MGAREAAEGEVVRAFDLETGAERRISSAPGFYYGPQYSPDGSRIVYSRSEARGRAFRERWGIPESTTDIRSAIEHPEVDVVVVGGGFGGQLCAARLRQPPQRFITDHSPRLRYRSQPTTPGERVRRPAPNRRYAMPDRDDTRIDAPAFEVYYDGGCPACRREMAHYRAHPSAVPIRYTDVVAEPERLAAIGITQRDAIHRLHARDEQGRLLVGMRAFLGVWLRIPRYAAIARRLEWLIASRPVEWLYARFCDFRFPRRCRNGACGLGARQ